MSKKNKHGLPRNIPSSVKAKIRKNSGYGCVICGNAIVEYEHVDPEYHEAKNHNASCMTLLCPLCHSKVTKGVISKKSVKEAMKNPWAFQNGMSYDDLELPPSNPRMHLGNSTFGFEKTLIEVKGKDLIRFFPPESANSPYRLSAEFYDASGNLVARVRKNIFESILGDQDVQFVGTKIIIKTHGVAKPALVLERVGGEDIRILELNMYYDGMYFSVDKDGEFTVTSGSGTMVFNNCGSEGCGSVFKF